MPYKTLQFDSVFSPLMQFERSVPSYEDDRAILPQKAIAKSINKIGDKFTGLMVDVVEAAALKLARDLEGKPLSAIDRAQWNVSTKLQILMRSLWQEGWTLGTSHGQREIKKAARQNYSVVSSLAEFEKKKKERLTDGGPPIKLDDSALSQAVDQRALRLGNDLDSKTLEEVKGHIKAGADSKNPISQSEVENRIRDSIGKQKLAAAQAKSGDTPDAPTQKSFIQGFAARAKKITRTELSAAYSTARLNAYLAAGIERVRWQFNERRRSCQICRDRSGSVHEIRDLLGADRIGIRGLRRNPSHAGADYDPSQYVIPAHPFCYCYWSPEFRDRKEVGRKPRRPGNNLVAIGRNWTVGALGIAGLYALLALVVRGRTGVGRAVGVAQAIAPTIEAAAEVAQVIQQRNALVSGAPTTVPPAFVGDLDINRAGLRELVKRLRLTGQEALNLKASIATRPLQNIQDLVDRVRRGEIIGLTENDLQTKILPRVRGAIQINTMPTENALISSLQGVGIRSIISRKIWAELQSPRGAVDSTDSLIERLRVYQGTKLTDRQQQVLDYYLSPRLGVGDRGDVVGYFPQGTNDVPVTQASRRSGVRSPVSVAPVDPIIPDGSGAIPDEPSVFQPSGLLNQIAEQLVSKRGQIVGLGSDLNASETQIRTLANQIRRLGLPNATDDLIDILTRTNASGQIDDVRFEVTPAGRAAGLLQPPDLSLEARQLQDLLNQRQSQARQLNRFNEELQALQRRYEKRQAIESAPIVLVPGQSKTYPELGKPPGRPRKEQTAYDKRYPGAYRLRSRRRFDPGLFMLGDERLSRFSKTLEKTREFFPVSRVSRINRFVRSLHRQNTQGVGWKN